MTSAAHSVTVRRRFSGRRERVFEAFRHKESLAQWFSPSPQVALQILAFEFEPEGAFRFRYLFPDGSQSTVKGVYRSIIPSKQLAFSWVWEEPDRHAGIVTEVEIDFVSKGSETEIVITHDRLPDRESEDRYDTGWTVYLDRLTSYVSNENVRRDT